MNTRLSVVFLAIAAASLLPDHAEAAAFICNEPSMPCEQTFSSPCTELLETGVVETSDVLRDDVTEGGCILCVPPGGSYSGPNPCPNCFCDDSGSMACTALAGTFISATETSGACPSESQYADYTNFTVIEAGCPATEMDCEDGGDVAVPTCNEEPGVPCEIPYPSTCAELLAMGEVTTDEVLRDDKTTGGCILCVPPNGFHAGPESCFECQCMDSEIVCSGLGSALFAVGEESGECPPSEYTDFTDFTDMKPPCKSIDAWEMELDCGDGSDVEPVLIAAPPVDSKPAKGEKQKQQEPSEKTEKTEKPDKADSPDKTNKTANTNESVEPAKMQKGKKAKGDRY
jgi:hypothetical protein